MSRSPVADHLERLLRERFPLVRGQTLALRSCCLGPETHPVGPSGLPDEIEAALCLRRGATFGTSFALVQLTMPGYLECASKVNVPLVTPDGWYVINGQAYDAAALEADIGARLGAWLDACCASTLERMAAEVPDDVEPEPMWLDTENSDEVFAPLHARPISPVRTRTLQAEVDGRAIRLDSGGVLVWPDNNDPQQARAYLELDHEEVAIQGPIQRGQRLFKNVNRVSRAFDANEPIEIKVREGDVITADDVVAHADGRAFCPGIAGRVVRVEFYGASGDDGASKMNSVFAEIHAAASRLMTEGIVNRYRNELAGRILRYKLIDDTGKVLGRAGDPAPLEGALTIARLRDIAVCLDDNDLEYRLNELADEADDLPMFQPPTWLERGNLPLGRDVHQRLRLVIAT